MNRMPFFRLFINEDFWDKTRGRDMFKKLSEWIVFTLIVVIFSSNIAVAAEVQRVETTGTIGFTGIYEPIGTPDPKPPESIVRPPITDVAKPDGRLPQTNVIGDPMLIWLGVLLISTVFFLGKRQKNQTTKR